MDFESIKRLGLFKCDIDQDRTFETYDLTHNNHIINLYLKKDEGLICPTCSTKKIKIIGSKQSKIKHACISEKNIIIYISRRKYRCLNCNKTFFETNMMGNKQTQSYSMELEILNSLKNINKSYK